MGDSDLTVVLVQGAWVGAWCWEAVGTELDRLGWVHRELDLPSLGPTAALDAGLVGDAAAVRALLDTLDGSVVLVGNSWGGAVITAAAVDHPGVAHLVYVAAQMPVADVPLMEQLALTDDFTAALRYTESGASWLDPELGAGLVCPQTAPDQAERAIQRFLPSVMSDVDRSLPDVAWRSIRSTYLVCTEDRCLTPDAQRQWATQRATYAMERPWDHAPGLSHPEELAEILAAISTEVLTA